MKAKEIEVLEEEEAGNKTNKRGLIEMIGCEVSPSFH